MAESQVRRRPRLLPLAAGLAALLVASGCTSSTGGSGGSGGTGPSGTGSSGPAPSGDDTMSSMLALLPETEDGDRAIVTITRWHAAAEAYGVEIPGPDASPDEIADYVLALTQNDGGLTSNSDLMSLQVLNRDSTEQQFGYRRQDISAEATGGQAPQLPQAARGSFDADAIARATKAGPVADDVEEVDVEGVPVLRWRDDFDVDMSQITALSRIGSSGRLAAPDEQTLLYATYDQGIEGLIAAHEGGPSLADDGDLAAVARALDDKDALSALIVRKMGNGGLAYLAAGIGWAYADGEGRMLLTYATRSEGDARTLADELEDLVVNGRTLATGQPWSDYLTDPDIAVDGAQVTATFGFEGPGGRWPQFLFNQENLF